MIDKKYNEFMPDVLEIIEKPVSKAGTAIIYSIFVFMAIVLLASYVGKLDVIVSARGQILPEGNMKVVQPSVTGALETLSVKEGDYVKAGQVLATIKADMLELDNSIMKESLEKLKYEKTLLEALLAGEAMPNAPNGLEYVLSYYEAIENSYKSSLTILDNQALENEELLKIDRNTITKLESSLNTNQNDIDFLGVMMSAKSTNETELEYAKGELASAEDLLERSTALYKAGVMSEISLMDIESQTNEIRNTVNKLEMQIRLDKMTNEARHTALLFDREALLADLDIQNNKIARSVIVLEQVNKNIERIKSERTMQYNTLLTSKNGEIFKYESDIRKLDLEDTGKYVKAPVTGVVHSVSVNTLGEVVQAGDTILTIVPDGEALIAELYVLNKDRGQIEAGGTVRIKVDAYPFQEFGTLEATVSHISANAFMLESVGYVYKVYARILPIDAMDSTHRQDDIALFSGMQITGEIKGGERRVIEYFLAPIIEAVDESLKQN